MKITKSSQAGFTLVEILVAIALAAIIIGSLTQIVTTNIHLAQSGRHLNLANSFVEGKVEALRNAGYSSLALGTTSLTSELPSQLPPGRSASMTVTSPTGGIKKIVITISYFDNGHTNSYGYTTYIGELGVGQ